MNIFSAVSFSKRINRCLLAALFSLSTFHSVNVYSDPGINGHDLPKDFQPAQPASNINGHDLPAPAADMSAAAASGGQGMAAGAAAAGAANGAAGVAMDAVGKGKSHIPPELQADLQALVATTKSGVTIPGLAAAQTAIQSYISSQPTCIADQARASGFCREQTSPELQSTLMMVNGFMSGASALGVTDSCNSAGKVLNMAKLGLTAYTAACGAMRFKCESSCKTAVQSAGQAIKALQAGKAVCPNTMNAACVADAMNANMFMADMVASLTQELNQADPTAIQGKSNLCNYKYGTLLLTAGVGILSTLNSFKQAKNCEKETKAAGKSESDQYLSATCSKKENANIPECICLANPRNPGCANSLIKLGNGDRATVSTGGNPNIGTGQTRNPAESGQSFAGEASPPSADGSLSAQAAGGFAGGGTGGGFETGASGKDKGEKEKKTEAFPGSYSNGADGMAGGGGSGWGGGSGGEGDSVYAAYLPGGQLDPSLLTGDEASGLGSDITSQGGDTNFQKIKLRFGVIRGSLMDQ